MMMILKPASCLMVVVAVAAAALLPVEVFTQGALSSSDQQAARIARDVADSLRSERDLRDVEVLVEGDVVTLEGRLGTFWAKDQAIKRVLAVEGVASVVSELEIPRAEDDTAVAQGVVRAIQGYTYYTVWDQIDGNVNDGVVSLSGLVTPDRDKIDEIFERVAKVRGVQDVRNGILRLPESQRDQELRQAIAYRVFRSEHFERFASMSNPPFHIIVDSGGVTLLGQVQSSIEAREMQRIVSQTQGIFSVDNRLQIVQR
jgi:osmotically-inducible protein OsmY